MTDIYAELERLKVKKVRVKEIEEELEREQKETEQIILNLLRAGAAPMEVADASPFSAAKQRILARAAGIPPAKKGGRKA